MAIGVESADRDVHHWCMACAEGESYKPGRAEFRVVADPVSAVREGAAIELCPRHALLLWNALGAMLMMREPKLLRMGHGPQISKAGATAIK